MNYKILGATLLSTSLLLAACGDTSTEKEKKEETATVEKATTKKEEPKTETTGFKNDTVSIDMADIKILGAEVVKKGTDQMLQKDSVVITYEIKGKTDEDITPSDVWFACMEVYQDAEGSEKKLDVGMMPLDEKYTALQDTQDDNVKKGGTVKSGMIYELADTNNDIIIKASKGIGGKKLGEKIIKLK